jgi:preprotein translocase subunit Sec63
MSIKAPVGSLKASLIYTALAVEEKLARGRKKGRKKKEKEGERKKGAYRLKSVYVLYLVVESLTSNLRV